MLQTLQKNYRLRNPSIKKLVGYDIVNYKVENENTNFILKVYPDQKEEIDFADAENQVLLHLQQTPNIRFPRPVRNIDDQCLTPFQEENTTKTARVLTFLEGDFLGDVQHSFHMFHSLASPWIICFISFGRTGCTTSLYC